MNKLQYINSLLILIVLWMPAYSWAKTKLFYLTLENNVFTPSELKIPAKEKVKLIIHNKDDKAEEFDSFDLNREKMLFPHKKAVIFIGPLLPGKYEYFGEYNPNSARGIIIVEVSNAN